MPSPPADGDGPSRDTVSRQRCSATSHFLTFAFPIPFTVVPSNQFQKVRLMAPRCCSDHGEPGGSDMFGILFAAFWRTHARPYLATAAGACPPAAAMGR